ncbi:MAG: radical SAM protein [Verrucomicrobiales bacterium]|nr:radical SAM protein [Verrucomicrobiales bacterium]
MNTLKSKPESIFFDGKTHSFDSLQGFSIDKALEAIDTPLSVILQVTRRCNFDCAFCSETTQMDDPTMADLDKMRMNLKGIQRVFLSGGEPLVRADFVEIASMFSQDFIVGLPTNATPGERVAEKLVGKVSFVNVGLEGPRSVTRKARGDYDKIMSGIRAFKEVGLPLSLSAVVLRSIVDAIPFTCQIADVIGAGKLKLILPIRKGNGLFLEDSEFISEEEAETLFNKLVGMRESFGWTPALRMTTWTPDTEGYSILTYPNGETYAWPVYDAQDKVESLGNLKEMSIQEIWRNYRFKRNHLRKYLGKSIRTIK